MKHFSLRTAAGIFCMLSSAAAFALPAKQGVIAAEQPDGTTVFIRLEGDERHHKAYSSDGYLLTNDKEGFYVFADCDAQGNIVATSLREINPEQRSAATISKLATINQATLMDASVKARSNAPARNPGLFSTQFPSKGEHNAIAILVEFKNKKFSIEDPNDYFTRMLNEEGFSDYNSTGSARDFFIECSEGIFKPYFDVYGPIELDQNYNYYGQNDAYGNEPNCWKLIVDGCQALDDEIDFSLYDANEDGYIDNVYVFYAGFGEADGGNANTIWPHSWDIEYATSQAYYLDGVRLNHYACSNELQYYGGLPDGIGSFVHEFGHVMGLPDLYSTTYSNAFTPGPWDVMDQGSYNNNSRTPPAYSSYERYALEWMEPTLLTESGEYELLDLRESHSAFILQTDKEDEFYLLENRQQNGNDAFIPGHGMLVWHIDFDQRVWNSNVVNNTATHQFVDLIEADNKATAASRKGDSFPGTGKVTSFTDETTPAFVSWSGKPMAVNLYDIEENDGVITFRAESTSETGIGSISSADNALRVNGNTIMVSAGTANVYDLSGRHIASVGAAPVELPSGMYIVSLDGKTAKIAIR